jgi:membrane-associated protease RseP (regulator of RpoE activity)
MMKLVHFALAVLFLLGIASAQNVPAIDIFGGYSYLNFDMPSNAGSSSQRLAFKEGWEASVSVKLFHRIAAEADVSDHQLNDCEGTSGLNCHDFSYMFGPRFTFGNHASRFTGFVHGLVGRDNATLVYSGGTISDNSVAVAAGGGLEYWFMRHVGVQLGPVDYFYTRHLNDFGLASQGSFRASGGIAIRFGGEAPSNEPKPAKEAKAEQGHRSVLRPWHKSKPVPSAGQPSTGQPSTAANRAPAAVNLPGRGMQIASFGAVLGPQEFDGAKILEILPGGVAEMASLHVGDLIKSVDGRPVRTPMELAAELSDKSGKVRIGIQRGDFATETLILLPRP